MAASTEERLTKLEVQYEKFSEQVLKQLDTILKRLDSMQSLNGNQSISIAGITERLRMHDDEIEKIWKEIMNLRKETKELSKSTTNYIRIGTLRFCP